MLLKNNFFIGIKAIRISSQLEMERDKSKLDRAKPKDFKTDEIEEEKMNP